MGQKEPREVQGEGLTPTLGEEQPNALMHAGVHPLWKAALQKRTWRS